MRFPKLNIRPQSREFVQEFGGLDRRPRISENCFTEMKNLTGDFYPALAPRRRRGVVGTIENCNALMAGEKLAYVSGNSLYWGEKPVLTLTAGENTPRQLVMMGAYLVVFPDNLFFNTADAEDYGAFHVPMNSETESFTFLLYRRGNEDAMAQSEENLLSNHEGAKYQLTGSHYIGHGGEVLSVYHVPHEFQYKLGSASTPTYTELQGIPNPKYAYTDANNNTIRPFGMYEVLLEMDGGSNVLTSSSSSIYQYAQLKSVDNYWGTIKVINKETGVSVTHVLRPGNGEGCTVDGDPGYWLRYYAGTGSTELRLDGTKVESILRVKSNWFSRVRFPDGYETDIKLALTKGDSFAIPYLSGVPTGNVRACFKDGDMWIEGVLFGTPSFTTVSVPTDSAQCYSADLDVVSTAPTMDFVIESHNRLWGCRYGPNASGELVNEIYASALGDFRQWYTFAGVSTDSYAVSVGVSGAFTGAVNYRGFPLFFKEGAMYKVYGDYPENYQVVTDTGMSLQKGCDKSLFVLSNVLYYKAPDGVFAYNGSSSERIDAVLGREHYSNVVCCGAGSKVWLSMTGESAEHSGLYVCDTEKGMWHKEDAVTACYMARFEGDVYIVDADGRIFTTNGSAGELEDGLVSFEAQTGIIGYSTPDSKYVSRFALRVAIPHDASLQIFVKYDSADVWEFKGNIEGCGMRTFTVPVVPKMCDHFCIRLVGYGNCRIFGFSKVLEEGGAV